MDLNKIKNKSNEEIKEKVDQEILRITVNKNAERALVAVVDQVNEGYVGGKVNRTQVANWILLRFQESLNDAVVKEVRMEYFDEVAMLESILRQAKESGKVPSEFKSLLQRQIASEELPKKSIKKALTKNVINDDMRDKL